MSTERQIEAASSAEGPSEMTPEPAEAPSSGMSPEPAGAAPPEARHQPGPIAGIHARPFQPRLWRLLLLLAAALLVLWVARGVLGPFVIAAVLAYAFSPLVAAAERRTGFPRIVVIVLGYAIALGFLGLAFILAAGPLARELDLLARGGGPDTLASALRQIVGGDTITIGTSVIRVTDVAGQLESSVSSLLASPGDALHFAGILGDVVLQGILTLIVTFYFLLDGSQFTAFGLRFLPQPQRERAVEILDRIHEVLGKWLRGQLFLIALVAVVVYLLLGPLLHVKYALALGALTGVLEVLPLVGPIAAAALAGGVALAEGGPGLAATVLVIYFIIRQVEDQVVMPIVIGRAVHLHPVVTIFAVLVGLSTWGILGGLLGVPVAAALNVTLRELYPEANAA